MPQPLRKRQLSELGWAPSDVSTAHSAAAVLLLRQHLALGRIDVAARAEIALGPIRILHLVHAHFGASARGVHELVLADVDADMGGDAAPAGGEEHQIAGSELFLVAHHVTARALLARGARQFQAGDLAKHVQHQPAAVEAFGGVVAAPAVGRADGGQAGLHHAVAQGGHGGFLRQAQAGQGGAGLFGGDGRLGGAG